MERSALYRRALALIMLFAGLLGLAAAATGLLCHLDSIRAFGVLWLGTAVVAVIGAFIIARRQALKDGEKFWSPPTRRIAQALLPPLTAGTCVSLVTIGVLGNNLEGGFNLIMTLVWMFFYGCAIHSAGFFMPRGMKLFGWIFIGFACGLCFYCAIVRRQTRHKRTLAHGLFLRRAASGLWRVSVFDRKRKECGVNPEPFLQLDRVIHEKGRLAIMSMLAASPELSFTELRDALGMTDGNLTTHIRTLQEAGYVSVAKSYQNNRPLTTCSLTRQGARLRRIHQSAGANRPAKQTLK